jgi:hypothetical protein
VARKYSGAPASWGACLPFTSGIKQAHGLSIQQSDQAQPLGPLEGLGRRAAAESSRGRDASLVYSAEPAGYAAAAVGVAAGFALAALRIARLLEALRPRIAFRPARFAGLRSLAGFAFRAAPPRVPPAKYLVPRF